MVCKNFDELEAVLKDKIGDALITDTFDTVKDTMYKHIINDVYMAYDPKVYQRRYSETYYGNSGLANEHNIQGYVNNNEELVVTNETKGNKWVNGSDTDTFGNAISRNYNKNIAGIIESGQGYDEGLFPRPFISNTANELRASGDHVKALKKGLGKQGLKVK